MPDPRFFDAAPAMGVAEIEAITGVKAGEALTPDTMFTGCASLSNATPQDISYFTDKRYLANLSACRAGAIFVGYDHAVHLPEGCIALTTRFPQAAWSRLAHVFYPIKRHQGALAVHPSAQFEADVSLGVGVVIGQDVEIGKGTRIEAYAVIGPGVRIGRNCVVSAHASIHCTYIGDRVTISAGARIGESGFGVSGDPSGLVDVPQLGRVIIQDDVSIGANSCVDRGAYSDTIIGEGSKIDNMVQIAHNVIMGRNCIVAAHSGISGSVTIGDGAMFGGRTGVVDHIKIGRGAKISAATVVLQDIAEGQTVSGYPAKPARQFLREMIWLEKNAIKKNKG